MIVTLHVVTGSCGEYDMRHEWHVLAFDSESAAKEFAERCEREVKAAAVDWRAVRKEWRKKPIEEYDAEVARRDKTLPDQSGISVDDFSMNEVGYQIETLNASLSFNKA